MGRKTTLSQEVQRADPRHNVWSSFPIEYEFSNGRIFRGRYKQRFPFTAFAYPLKADGVSNPLKADGVSKPTKARQL